MYFLVSTVVEGCGEFYAARCQEFARSSAHGPCPAPLRHEPFVIQHSVHVLQESLSCMDSVYAIKTPQKCCRASVEGVLWGAKRHGMGTLSRTVWFLCDAKHMSCTFKANRCYRGTNR